MRSVKRWAKLISNLWVGRMKKSDDRRQKANEKSDDSIGTWYYKNKQLEAKAEPFCKLGNALETTKAIRCSFHTGDNNWMESRTLPIGTVFLILEGPEYNGESWMYEIKIQVLGEGRKALVDIAELAEAVKEV